MTADLSAELVRAIATNLSETLHRVPEWDALAMIIGISGSRFSSSSGYVYSADGKTTPVSANALAINKTVEAYVAEKYPSGEYPVAMLVQYDRVTGRYEFTFEDNDRSRWKVTPRNFKEMPETVRPRFDE